MVTGFPSSRATGSSGAETGSVTGVSIPHYTRILAAAASSRKCLRGGDLHGLVVHHRGQGRPLDGRGGGGGAERLLDRAGRVHAVLRLEQLEDEDGDDV